MDFVIQLSIIDLVKIVLAAISVALNITVLFRWFKKRLVLDEFLAGQWEGILTPDDECDHTHVVKCTIMISKHRDKQNTAYIIYRRIDLGDDGSLISVGLDTLTHYNRDSFFFYKRQWKPTFVRVFHKDKDKISLSKTRYDFQCIAEKVLFKPRLRVTVTLADGSNWTGQWSKH